MIDTTRWGEISALFDELVELPLPERERRLAALADSTLADEVRALLAADDEHGVLDAPVTAALPDLRTDDPAPDRCIGAWRLLRPIGEGGMGVVWLGERVDGAFEQRVAIKVLKRGMDTHAILRRFLLERRILARLRHEHIVRLIDGGMSDDGRPFYVMDHVGGRPLTTYATQTHLDVTARVALLARVAEAVAYAHTQLVVHRDLKPSNVLVDAEGEPRVLDFGIAKLLEESGEQTRTGTGLRVLSPAYAAPEQILGESIGTATDVYALGLMLCELLVGRLPRQRRGASAAQLAQDAENETIERPATLAARLPAAEVEALYGAGTTPAMLARRLAGDLDVIVAKALQRDPARRYAGAAAFAGDLRRWLEHRPIHARPDSRAYRARQFVRRHRVGVGAAALIAVALLGGLGTALWQARIARGEALRADAERRVAEQQLARTERVKQFILTLFRETDPVARASAQARSPLELVKAGIADVEASFGDQPELQAELLHDLGEIQTGLDDPKSARETLKRAWEQQKQLSGEDSVASAQAQAAYGDAVYLAGDVAAATSLLNQAISRLQARGQGNKPKTAQAESTLALIELIGARKEEAERLARHALQVDRESHGSGSLQAAVRLTSLGKILQETGRYEDALACYREALTVVVARGGEDHARAALLHTFIADVLRVQQHYDQALPEYEAAVRIERKQLPPGHSILGGTLIRLGDLQRRMQLLDAADASLTEAIGILAPTGSGQYAQALQFSGNLAREQGRFELAVQRYGNSIDVFRKVTGDSIYTWLTALVRIQAFIDAGQLAQADAAANEAVVGLSKLPDDDYASLFQASVLADLRHEQGRFVDAIKERRRTVDGLLKMYGRDHAETIQSHILLASSLIATGDVAQRTEASELLDDAHSALDAKPTENAISLHGLISLARARLRYANGDLKGARADLDNALEKLRAKPVDVRHLRTAQALARRIKS